MLQRAMPSVPPRVQLTPSGLVIMRLVVSPWLAHAANKPIREDQQTDRQLVGGDVVGAVLVVHETPSGLDITEEVRPTATNNLRSEDQQIEVHERSAQLLAVHSVPFSLVITLFPVPELATAQNLRKSGDQQTEFQLLLGQE